MGKFTKRPVGLLDNIYRFVGGQTGPNRFAEEMAIQPVHDVSREAEISTAQSAALGYFHGGFIDTHVGIGTIFRTDLVYDKTFLDLEPIDVDVWIVDATCNVNDEADFVSAAIGIEYPIIAGAFGDPVIKLVREFLSGGATSPLISGELSPVQPVDDFCVLPIYAPHGAAMVGRSEADNGGTVAITYVFLMWAGARGTLPPGHA